MLMLLLRRAPIEKSTSFQRLERHAVIFDEINAASIMLTPVASQPGQT